MTGNPSPTGFYLHPAAALHDTGWGHPEHQGRLRAVSQRVGKAIPELLGRVEYRDPAEASDADLLRVHEPGHLERVREGVERSRETGKVVALTADTNVSDASWDAASGSSGTAVAACRAVVEGAIRNAFVATRPPGHHATRDRAMGFCLFNHVAVAAEELRRAHGFRVLVVDWDVHHGNGTQEIFYDDPSVFYLSLHQSPHYPGTGSAGERGSGPGEGTTLNVPLAAGTPREDYLAAFRDAVQTVRARFDPDMILVSGGFDALAGDPLGGMLLEPEDMEAMTLDLRGWADREMEGRMVVLLEGGYVPERLGEGVVSVLRALASGDDLSDRERV